MKILTTRLDGLKTAHPSFHVNPDVIAYVAKLVATNGRDLDGAANRILAHATLTGASVTMETAEAAIRDLVRTREPRRVKIEDIQKLVATRYNVSRADILSERRTTCRRGQAAPDRDVSRQGADAALAADRPPLRRARDHTTVLHAVRKIESDRRGPPAA